MLAPLKDRSVLGATLGDDDLHTMLQVSTNELIQSQTKLQQAESEIADLKHALRESNRRLQQNALNSACDRCKLQTEMACLEARCAAYQQELERYVSGVAVMSLGQALMRLTEQNEALRCQAQQAFQLEKNLMAAHQAYQQLAEERDQLHEQLFEHLP